MPHSHIVIRRQIDPIIMGQEFVHLWLIVALGSELLDTDVNLVLSSSRYLLGILNGLSHIK